MTKEETIKIMALLGAFYAGGKNDPKVQAQAWYMILYKYDFNIAKCAVLRFAENDNRDYATFPAVGKIVEAIKAETAMREKPIKEIMLGISYGTGYGNLSSEAQKLITADMYTDWLKIDAYVFQRDAEHYMDILRVNRRHLLGDNNGKDN